MTNDCLIESECLQDSIGLHDGKFILYRRCVCGGVSFQDSKGFLDIYIKRDFKWLLDSMGIWDSKCVWDVIWLQGSKSFLGYLQEKG